MGVDMNLFGPDFIQKPWNYNKDFLTYAWNNKTARFGYLSIKVLCNCVPSLALFWAILEGHDYITNKLACLVRSAFNHEYIKVVITAIASVGLHLIEPFYMSTFSENEHYSLHPQGAFH